MRRLAPIAIVATTLAVMATPLAANAQQIYPHGWKYSTPPSWFAETVGPINTGDFGISCEEKWAFEHVVYGTDYTYYEIAYGECGRYWSPGVEETECIGGASNRYGPSTGRLSDRFAGYECRVDTSNTICSRRLDVYEWAAGQPHPFGSTDTGWDPYDCRSELTGWPDRSFDVLLREACAQAQRKVQRAKKKFKKADTAKERKKAKKKLRKAKRKNKKYCDLDALNYPEEFPELYR